MSAYFSIRYVSKITLAPISPPPSLPSPISSLCALPETIMMLGRELLLLLLVMVVLLLLELSYRTISIRWLPPKL